MSARAYRYVAALGAIQRVLLFFGACAGIMFAMAASDRHRMRLFGIVLDPTQTLWFEIIIGILAAGFVVVALISLLFLRGEQQQVIVADDGLTIPPTAFSRRVTIPWERISSVDETRLRKTRFLQIRHDGGKATIGEKMIGEAGYAEVSALIAERIRTRAPIPPARTVQRP